MKQWNIKIKKLYSAKHLKPWLMNWTDQQSVHKWETSKKKANIDKVNRFCVVLDKVALLT